MAGAMSLVNLTGPEKQVALRPVWLLATTLALKHDGATVETT